MFFNSRDLEGNWNWIYGGRRLQKTAGERADGWVGSGWHHHHRYADHHCKHVLVHSLSDRKEERITRRRRRRKAGWLFSDLKSVCLFARQTKQQNKQTLGRRQNFGIFTPESQLKWWTFLKRLAEFQNNGFFLLSSKADILVGSVFKYISYLSTLPFLSAYCLFFFWWKLKGGNFELMQKLETYEIDNHAVRNSN